MPPYAVLAKGGFVFGAATTAGSVAASATVDAVRFTGGKVRSLWNKRKADKPTEE